MKRRSFLKAIAGAASAVAAPVALPGATKGLVVTDTMLVEAGVLRDIAVSGLAVTKMAIPEACTSAWAANFAKVLRPGVEKVFERVDYRDFFKALRDG